MYDDDDYYNDDWIYIDPEEIEQRHFEDDGSYCTICGSPCSLEQGMCDMCQRDMETAHIDTEMV